MLSEVKAGVRFLWKPIQTEYATVVCAYCGDEGGIEQGITFALPSSIFCDGLLSVPPT